MTKRGSRKRTKLVGYTRVSVPDPEVGKSLEGQVAAIRDYANEIGADLLEIEEDIQSGGGDPFAREGLRAIVGRAARDGAAIVVTRVDRLARDLGILKILREHRIAVWVVGRGKITRDDLKRELIDAVTYRTVISSKVKESHMKRQAKPSAPKPRIDPATQRKGCLNNHIRAFDRDMVIFQALRQDPQLLKLTHRELAEALNTAGMLNRKKISGETKPWDRRSAGDLRRRFDKVIELEHEMDREDLKRPPFS